MPPKQSWLTSVDVGLLTAIVVLLVLGVAFAVFTGVVSVPGIKPFLMADATPSPTLPPALPKVAAVPSFVPSVVPSVVPANPSPSPSPSPSPLPTPPPDAPRKEDLAKIQVALTLYYKKHHQYPVSKTFTAGRTDSPTTPLKVLVSEGHLTSLPVDPKTPAYWYGYKADGTSYSLTARLEDTTDPSGRFDDNKTYLYTVTN